MKQRIGSETFTVDPARLAAGRWSHEANKDIGKGDIYGSYSADRIGMGQPVRKPFLWKGAPHVCVGISHYGGTAAEAYRLVPVRLFGGDPTTYAEKLADSEAARADPMGFYHGMIVRHGGERFILSGPPIVFVPGRSEQLALF
ncbi:MAG: hypothetical protein ACOC91_01575 [bacterium]